MGTSRQLTNQQGSLRCTVFWNARQPWGRVSRSSTRRNRFPETRQSSQPRATAGAAGRLRFISKRSCLNDLAGGSLGRVVEEELIAVGIIDHQEPVAPRTLLDRNALGLEFRAQRVQRGDLRLRLEVQGNEHQPLANLLRPRVGQDKRAALPVDLCDMRSAVLVVARGAREAEPVNVKAERGLNVRHVQDGAREPVCHRLYILE